VFQAKLERTEMLGKLEMLATPEMREKLGCQGIHSRLEKQGKQETLEQPEFLQARWEFRLEQ